jgi:hypothetical protein
LACRRFAVDQFGALLSVVSLPATIDRPRHGGGTAAGGQRRGIIALGVAAATLLRLLFAYFAAQILAIIGLALAGGVLLLWVWGKLFRELRAVPVATSLRCRHPVSAKAGSHAPGRPARVLGRIVLADVSMSLDNVLAVAGDRTRASVGAGLRLRALGRVDCDSLGLYRASARSAFLDFVAWARHRHLCCVRMIW